MKKKIGLLILVLFTTVSAKPKLKEVILEKEGGKETIAAKKVPDFSIIATTKEGMFAASDDLGTSYYYRGKVENNFVLFGGYYWQIVRIAGNGDIKLIFRGTQVDSTGVDSTIGKTKFYENHALESINYLESDLKKLNDAWYKANIKEKGLDYYVSDNIFCFDRSSRTSVVNGTISFGAIDRSIYGRSNTKNKPILTCPNDEDKMTVKNNKNASLTYPIGNLTFDEYTMAGANPEEVNTEFYLGISNIYEPRVWTMSPNICEKGTKCSMFVNNSNGQLPANVLETDDNYSRPSIYLRSDIEILKGDGTSTSPYEVGFYTADELLEEIEKLKHLLGKDVENKNNSLSSECMSFYEKVKDITTFTKSEIDEYMNELKELKCFEKTEGETVNPPEKSIDNPSTGLYIKFTAFFLISAMFIGIYFKKKKYVIK